MTEIKASLKYIKGSNKKLDKVLKTIRGLSVSKAMLQLCYCENRSAEIIKKLLESAVANAKHNNKIGTFEVQNLKIYKCESGRAFVLKRHLPRGRGRMDRIEKKYSNLKIVLCEQLSIDKVNK